MILLFTTFFIIPFFESFYYSFTNWTGISSNAKFIGLRNFVNIITSDDSFIKSFKFTFEYTAITTIIINLFCIFLAYILTKGIRFEKKLRMAFFLPNTIGLVLIGIVWNFILGPLAYDISQKTGIAFIDSHWLTNPILALLSVSFATLWAALGWYTLVYIAGFEGIPIALIEAANIEGCNAWQEFIYVKLPLIVPAITICTFLALTNGLKVFDILWTMTRGGPGEATQSVIMNIYNSSFNSFLYGYGVAKSILLVLVIGLIGIIQVTYTKKKEVEY